MKRLILKFEPVIWFSFGGGFMVGCLLLPAYVFVTGIAAPLGWLPADALAYERAHELGASLAGRVLLLVLIVLPLWNGANHLRHVLLDFGGQARDEAMATLLYGLAAACSVLALIAVVRL